MRSAIIKSSTTRKRRGDLLKSRKKILIVEDDSTYREVLKAGLENRGFAVNTAGTGAEALWNLSQEKPDLILLDLLMPEMSGEHVCRLIKTDPALKDIIVFILSGKNDLQTKLNCLNMGAEEYVLKPMEMEELTTCVSRFLEFADRHKPVVPSEERTMTIGIEDREKTAPDLSVNATPVGLGEGNPPQVFVFTGKERERRSPSLPGRERLR